MSSNGNNNELTALFDLLCKISEDSNLASLAANVVRLIKEALRSQLDQDKVGKPIVLPYKDLTDLVFCNQSSLPPSEVLTIFRNLVMTSILKDEYCTKNTVKDTEERKNHFMSCYDKIINHIQLAQIQRDYIQQVTKSAEKAANQAEKTAKKAKRTAQKAEQTYNTMFANYVTILGIFTAIIVTIFGGLNVVDAIISYGDAHFSTIVFLATLVLMCMVCLLYFLAKIILKLNGKDDGNQKCTLECLFGVILVACVVFIGLVWYFSPTKMTPKIDDKTSQDNIEQKSDSN